MSEPSGLWLRISPDSSRLYLGFLTAAHVLALIGSLAAGVPGLFKTVLVIAIVGSCYIQLRRARLDRNETRPLIVYGEQDGWSFRIGAGPPVHADLLASSVAIRWITILHFRTAEKRIQSFVIPRDSVSPEEYRRLRMILKIAGKNG
ncbi:MAG: hypothetical protein L0Y38_06905 [Methylococcaceae bacterium]|nr:hypothetical protein [Methylococcaceae bacterium]MCI0733535.1 hypothetical protein [Methylococcaceae bacterium]